jgi:NADPH:quinone reductase-like Zn-dependent oxidoreductase
MSTKQETNIAAVIEQKGARLKILNRDIPKPGLHELVVRNHAIAANPVDWKIQDYGFAITKYPNALGSDGWGVVIAVGSLVTKFKVGDRVTGFAGVIYTQNPDHGAWQTYEVLREIATLKIPDSMSFEEGSTFPMAFATSAIALFGKLDFPRPGGSVQRLGNNLLIWGAASSVGSVGIQLAKNSGFKVFATASPAHHEYLKSLGTFAVFDYKDPDVVSNIAAAAQSAGSQITLGYDTISRGTTFQQTAETLLASGGKGGRLILTLPWSGKDPQPEGIVIQQTSAYSTGTDREDIWEWLFNEYLPKALENKSIVAVPKVQIVEGGIGAAQKVFDQLKAGVSGKKLVGLLFETFNSFRRLKEVRELTIC